MAQGQEGRGQPEAQSTKPRLRVALPTPYHSAYCYSALRMSLAQRETCIDVCKESCK